MLRDSSTGEVCIYADADTLFLGDVGIPIEAMGENAVLLTPHLMGPSCDDEEHGLMMHGWMNGGVIAFARRHRDTRVVLDWLIDRISRRGFYATQYGLCVDQTWISALPWLFRDVTFVSSYPGLNVGYWNVAERPLSRVGEEILAGGSPLLLFHFSGSDGMRSGRLSRHSEVLVPPDSPLEDVCQRYQSELDGVAGLRTGIEGLGSLACSKANLQGRIHAGCVRNGVNIAAPTTRLGLFSSLGGRVDSLLRRAWAFRDV